MRALVLIGMFVVVADTAAAPAPLPRRGTSATSWSGLSGTVWRCKNTDDNEIHHMYFVLDGRVLFYSSLSSRPSQWGKWRTYTSRRHEVVKDDEPQWVYIVQLMSDHRRLWIDGRQYKRVR